VLWCGQLIPWPCSWCSHHGSTVVRVHLIHMMNADWMPHGCQPSDQANQPSLRVCRYRMLPYTSITATHHYYSSLKLILIYCATEGEGTSRLMHYSKGVQPVSKAVYCSGCRDKHNCLQWDLNLPYITPPSGMLLLDYWDLYIKWLNNLLHTLH